MAAVTAQFIAAIAIVSLKIAAQTVDGRAGRGGEIRANEAGVTHAGRGHPRGRSTSNRTNVYEALTGKEVEAVDREVNTRADLARHVWAAWQAAAFYLYLFEGKIVPCNSLRCDSPALAIGRAGEEINQQSQKVVGRETRQQTTVFWENSSGEAWRRENPPGGMQLETGEHCTG